MGHIAKADELLGQLTLEEKVSLCGASDWWRTTTVKRDGKLIVPHIKVTHQLSLDSKMLPC